MTGRLRVRRMNLYQHYRHRRPPWVKLHRRILPDLSTESASPRYHELDAETWRLGLEILILCSESEDRSIPDSITELEWRLRRTIDPKSIDKLCNIKFLERFASSVLAPCKQDASTEREYRVNKAKSTSVEPEREAQAGPTPLLCFADSNESEEETHRTTEALDGFCRRFRLSPERVVTAVKNTCAAAAIGVPSPDRYADTLERATRSEIEIDNPIGWICKVLRIEAQNDNEARHHRTARQAAEDNVAAAKELFGD